MKLPLFFIMLSVKAEPSLEMTFLKSGCDHELMRTRFFESEVSCLDGVTQA